MRLKDFIEIHDWTAAEVMELFELAKDIKAKPKKFRDALEGQTLAMIFEKSSTRTRVSFETGMFQLGGQALFLSTRDIQLGRGEPISDRGVISTEPGLYVVGRPFLYSFNSHTIGGVGRDVEHVVEHLCARPIVAAPTRVVEATAAAGSS